MSGASQTDQRPEVVVVTGASAGGGRATVKEFAKAGAHIGLLMTTARTAASVRRKDLAATSSGGPRTDPGLLSQGWESPRWRASYYWGDMDDAGSKEYDAGGQTGL